MTKRFQADTGFTLVELLMVISLTAVLMTLGVFSIRHFWFVRSLSGAQDEVITQLRRQQQQSVAESHPRIYGARFPGSGTSGTWGLLRVQLGTGGAPSTCVQYETRRFDGVRIFSPGNSSHTDFADSPEATLCRAATGGGAQDEFVFFYARGTATPGQLKLHHPILDRKKLVCVFGLTGRIEARDGNSCS